MQIVMRMEIRFSRSKDLVLLTLISAHIWVVTLHGVELCPLLLAILVKVRFSIYFAEESMPTSCTEFTVI